MPNNTNPKRADQTGNSQQPPLAEDDGSSILPFAVLSEDHYVDALGVARISTSKLLANDKGGNAKRVVGVSDKDGEGALVSLLDEHTLLWDAAGRYDYLPEGETAIDQFEYTLQVGNGVTSTAQVTVYVMGENDLATITGDLSGAVTEDDAAAGTTGGIVSVTDLDQGEATFQDVEDIEGIYGAFSFSREIGEWIYSLNNDDPDLEELDEDEIAYDTLTVTSADGTASEDIRVAVHGADEETSGFLGKDVEILWREPEKDSRTKSPVNDIYTVSDEREIVGRVWTIDIDNDTIRISSPGGNLIPPGSNFVGYQFRDANNEVDDIIDVDVTFSLAHGFDERAVTYDEDNVWVNLVGIDFHSEEYINIDLTFA